MCIRATNLDAPNLRAIGELPDNLVIAVLMRGAEADSVVQFSIDDFVDVFILCSCGSDFWAVPT